VSRGFIELRTAPIDLAAVLRTAVETVSARIESAERNISVVMPKEPLVVTGDAVRLTQVVVNLLHNATTYTRRNGNIWLSARRDEEHAILSVRDDGVGLAPDTLVKVFEMFMQVDRARAGGLGIGLTLARSLVQLHGGVIEAKSEGLGQGCEFIVRLPLHRGPKTMDSDVTPNRVDLTAKRFLVVDDNQDAADSLGMMLGMFGAEVRIAYDGKDALRIAEKFRPNLIFLDIGMPTMDGYEVARRLRSEPAARDCTLVAVTGWGQAADRQRTARGGFDHHLTKPVAVETLIELFVTLSLPSEVDHVSRNGQEQSGSMTSATPDGSAR
jgi:CheY-like chemotaxis protein